MPNADDARPTIRSLDSRLDQAFAILSPLILLAVWEVASRTGVIDPRIVAPPSAVATTLWEMGREGTLWTDVWVTTLRFASGTVVGLFPGLFVGLTLGLFSWPRRVFLPLVMLLYPIPRIALFPLVLILIGLNETSNLIMIALGPFFTMVITTMAAVRDIDPIYLDVARSFETPRWALYRLVTFPAALPVIMGAIRVSVGLGLLATVAVEFLVAENGIGNLIWRSWQLLSLQRSLAGLVLGGMLGFVTFYLVDRMESRLIPWQGR